MGEIIRMCNEKNIRNFESYFTVSGAYIEEFDTVDGRHWINGCKIEDYTPDIRKEAIRLGVIDADSNLITD